MIVKKKDAKFLEILAGWEGAKACGKEKTAYPLASLALKRKRDISVASLRDAISARFAR